MLNNSHLVKNQGKNLTLLTLPTETKCENKIKIISRMPKSILSNDTSLNT